MQMELRNWLLEVRCCSPNGKSFSLLKAKCLLAFQSLSASLVERDAFNNGHASAFAGAGKPLGGVCLLPKCLKQESCARPLPPAPRTLWAVCFLNILLLTFHFLVFRRHSKYHIFQRVEIALLSLYCLRHQFGCVIMAQKSTCVMPYCWRMVCGSFKSFAVHFVLLFWLFHEIGNNPDVIWEALQKYWHCWP